MITSGSRLCFTALVLAGLAGLPSGAARAQSGAVSGRVVAGGNGSPLAQATVRLDGQPAGTHTDEAGRFTLALAGAAPAAKLVFSHLGYETQVLPVDQLPAEVKLEELSYQIGEVVVTYTDLRRLLVRKWKIDEGSLDAAGQRLLAELQKRDPAKAAKLAKNPDAVRSVLKMARYDFRDDGTVKVKILLFGAKREWKLDEAQRTLTVLDADDHRNTVAVTELTADRLVLTHSDSELPAVVYVPAD